MLGAMQTINSGNGAVSSEVWHGTASTRTAASLLASSTVIFSRAGTHPVQNSVVHGVKGAVSNQKTLVADVYERDLAWSQPSELKAASRGTRSPAAGLPGS